MLSNWTSARAAAAIVALLGGSCAWAGPLGSGGSPVEVAPQLPVEGLITDPDWAERPTGDDVSRFYPPLAVSLRLSGRAMVLCSVTSGGTLTGCSTLGQSPAGFGFGDAALHLTSLFRMRPRMLNGTPVPGGSVRIPIRFAFPQETDSSADTKSVDAGPEPSVAALALARRLNEATAAYGQTRASIAEQMKGLRAQLAQSGLTQEQSLAVDVIEQTANDVADRYLARTTRSYAQAIPEAELAQIAAFLESRAGQLWVKQTAIVSRADFAASQDMSAQVAREAHARLCAKITCLAEDAPAGR
jgi:TonB family protein